MENIGELLNQYGGLILAVVVLGIVWLVNRNVSAFKSLLSAIFLDVQKRIGEAALQSGPEAMAAALQQLFDVIPARFVFVLNVGAFLLGTTSDKLAANIAQRVYDELRRQANPAKSSH